MKCPDISKHRWDGAKQGHIQGSSALKRWKRDPTGGRALFPPQADTHEYQEAALSSCGVRGVSKVGL